MEQDVEKLQELVDQYDRIVFFGGAGVSTESGIPDFRSVDGLYNQKYDYPPETILSHTFFMRHTDEFYRFYRDKMLFPDAQPNAAHRKLAELEQAGKLTAEKIEQTVAPSKREMFLPLKVTFTEEELRPYFPKKDTTIADAKRVVFEALDLRQRALNRQKAKVEQEKAAKKAAPGKER